MEALLANHPHLNELLRSIPQVLLVEERNLLDNLHSPVARLTALGFFFFFEPSSPKQVP